MLEIKGSVTIIWYRNGVEFKRIKYENIITNDGMILFLHHIKGTATGTYNINVFATHIGLGDKVGPSDPILTQTDLDQPAARYALDQSTVDGVGMEWEGEIFLDNNEGNGKTYTEIGIFTTGSGGLMLGRLLCGSIEKNSDIELIFKYNIKIANKVV